MARPLNVLLVAPRLEPGGPSAYVENLARGLHNRRHAVHVATSGGPGIARISGTGAKVHALPGLTAPWWRPDALHHGRLVRLSRAEGIEVVHAVAAEVSQAASRLSRSLGTPHVLTVHHDPGSISVGAHCGGVLAVSESLRQSLVNKHRVSKELISVVRYGLGLSRYTAGPRAAAPSALSDSAINRDLQSEGGTLTDASANGGAETGGIPVVCAIGQLVPNQGAEFLLRAVRSLLDGGGDLELLLVGEGPHKRPLRSLVRSLKLNRRVTFMPGAAPATEVLPAVDVYVQPDLSEGLRIELIEAMACARPVIACSVGGIQEVIRDESNGLLVRPRDARAMAERIGRLLADPGLRGELGLAARERVEESFGLTRMIDEVESIYERARTGSVASHPAARSRSIAPRAASL